MTAKAVRNVVFDMGGVLIKWQPLLYARRFSESDEDAALLAKAVFGSVEWAWQDAGAMDADIVAWTAQQHLPKRLHESADALAHRWYEKREAIEGMDELIRDLKAAGFGIYLLSNAGVQVEQYKQGLPGYDCFDGLLFSCFEHMGKPDPRFYQTLLERYGLKADECLFVDDTEHNVRGAERVGMQGWHFDGKAEHLRAFLLGA